MMRIKHYGVVHSNRTADWRVGSEEMEWYEP